MDLNDQNFLLFAARHYENPQCETMDEFFSDLLVPVHLKKLFTRYHVSGLLKERLVLNHLVSFFNVFNNSAAILILFYKIDEKYYTYLKTFLVYMNRCPEKVLSFNGKTVNLKEIPVDEVVLAHLYKSENNK